MPPLVRVRWASGRMFRRAGWALKIAPDKIPEVPGPRGEAQEEKGSMWQVICRPGGSLCWSGTYRGHRAEQGTALLLS